MEVKEIIIIIEQDGWFMVRRMKEAIRFHIDGLKKEGIAIPEPSTEFNYIEITI